MPDINPYAPGEISTQKISSRPIEYPGHQIKLTVAFDVKYLTDAALRATPQRFRPTTTLVGQFIQWAIAIVLVGLAVQGFAARRPQYLSSAILLAVAVYALFNNMIIYWLLIRRFKSLPHLNQRFYYLLTDEGLLAGSEDQKAKVLWYAFTDVIDFSDGVLLCQSKQVRHWLPFAALENPNDSSILYSYILSRLSPDVTQEHQTVERIESVQAVASDDNDAETPIRAAVVINEAHQLEKSARYWEYKRSWLKILLRYSCVLVLLGIAIYLATFTTQYIFAGFAAVVAVYVMLYYKIRVFRAMRDLRSARHYNKKFFVTFSDKGFSVKSPLQEGNIEWTSFNGVAAFPDGVLLLMGKSNCHWVSFSSLENPSDASRLYEFVSSRIQKNRTLSAAQTLPQKQEA